MKFISAPSTSKIAAGAASGEQSALRMLLIDRDLPCPGCEYNLRDLASNTCPECGAPLTLHVGSPRIALGGWMMAVLSLAIPFGFALVMALTGLVGALIEIAWMPGDWNALGVLVVASGLLGGALWAVARSRAAIIARPAVEQWMIGLGACAASVLFTVIFIAILGEVLR